MSDGLLLLGFGGPTPGCCGRRASCPRTPGCEAECFVAGILGDNPARAARVSEYVDIKSGVSARLTIAALADDHFEVAVIPKTWTVTNFSHLRPGDSVNLEADIIAKYVERILTVGAASARGGASDGADGAGGAGGLTLEKLAGLGYK